jgi:tetratricopeptide (TPR) repeat protein
MGKWRLQLIVLAYYYKARSHFALREFDDSIYSYFRHLEQLDEGGYGKGTFYSLYNIGIAYHMTGENHKALLYLYKSLMYLNFQPSHDPQIQWPVIDKFMQKLDRAIFVVNQDICVIIFIKYRLTLT